MATRRHRRCARSRRSARRSRGTTRGDVRVAPAALAAPMLSATISSSPSPRTIAASAERRRSASSPPPNGTTTLTAGRASSLIPVGRHPIGVEDRLDVAQPPDALAQLLGVADLDDEAVLDHRVLGRAAASMMLTPASAKVAREVLEQAGAIPGVDLELDPVGRRVVALPGDVGEPLRRLLQRGHVPAVLAVDRDPAPERDVADDLVAGNRAAALGEAHHHVLDALDLDPVVGRLLRAPLALVAPLEHAREARLGLVAGDGLALLQALEDLVGDGLRARSCPGRARCRSRRPCGTPSRG